LIFCPQGGKVGDLWFERTGHVSGGIDDSFAKPDNGFRLALPLRRKLADIRVQAHAQQ